MKNYRPCFPKQLITLGLLGIVIGLGSLSAQITTYPYFTDFEAGPGGWTSGALAANGFNSWEIGTPGKATINSAHSGDSAWVTGATVSYDDNEESYVQSPVFDMSGLVNPQIDVRIWWELEDSFDGVVLQSSIDGGLTWQRVGDNGDPVNWYNDNTISGIDNFEPSEVGWTGSNNDIWTSHFGSGGWVLANHDLTGLGGQNSVLLRFAFGADFSIITDGFAFDDVRIYEGPPSDASAFALLSPGPLGCDDPVRIQYINFGSQAISNTTVGYTVNGNTVTNVDPQTVAAGDTAIYTFAAATGLPGGTYSFTIFASSTGDARLFNDTITGINRTLVGLATLPQNVDFAGYNGTNLPTVHPGWREANGAQPGGTTSLWTSANATQQTAFGFNTARINLFTDSREEWILSPRFVPTLGSVLSFDVAVTNFSSAAADPDGMAGTDDSVRVAISTDCGLTFTDLLVFDASSGLDEIFDPVNVALGAYAGQEVIVGFYATDGPINDLPDYDFHVANVEIRDCNTGLQAGLWRGCFDTDWNNPANWDDNAVPTAVTDVTISPTASFFPQLTPGTYNVNNLTVPLGTQIDQGSATINVGGDLDVQGTWNCSGGKVVVNGNGNQEIDVISTLPTANSSQASLGDPARTSASSGTSPNFGLEFTSTVAFTLDTVSVYVNSTSGGTFDVQVTDNAGTVLQTQTVTIAAGENSYTTGVPLRLPLGLNIQPGVGKRLIVNNISAGITSLQQFSGGVTAYPYTDPGGNVSITGGFIGSGTFTTVYILFFDWHITIGVPFARGGLCELEVDKAAGDAILKNDLVVKEQLDMTEGGLLSENGVVASGNDFKRLLVNRGTSGSVTQVDGYFMGEMQRRVNAGATGAFLFPLGFRYNGGPSLANARVSFGNVSRTGMLTTSFRQTAIATLGFPLIDADGQQVDNPTDPNGVYWIFSKNDSLLFTTYDVQLRYDSLQNAPFRADELRVVARANAGAAWQFNGTNQVVATTEGGRTGLSAMGEYSFGSPATLSQPLPVELLSFTGTRVAEGIDLSWRVSHEHNVSHYEVERRTARRDFAKLGRVSATNEIGRQQYGWLDAQPTNGRNIYRLRTVDLDGSLRYSETVEVVISDDIHISLYPNPAHEAAFIRIDAPEAEAMTFTLFAPDGREVMRQSLSSQISGAQRIDLAELASGVYFYRIEVDASVFTGKITRQ